LAGLTTVPAASPSVPADPAPVTVVMPMYQAQAYIGEALASVAAQTVRPERVLVVDDGSTDAGPALAAAFPGVELVRRPHEGIAATINAGLALVRTEFVAFLDADDRWTQGKTARQLALLHADPALAFVFGHARRFLMTPEGEQPLDVLPGRLLQGGLFRRACFERVGVYSTESGTHGFLDWHARADEAGLRSVVIPEVVFERRIHGANHGLLHREEQRRGYFNSLKAALDRRRAAP